MSISIPGADYSPQLTGYTGQGAFRFWCQKVLPIVYDDSLSYYELLNKVVVYLNNVISDVASVEENIGRLNDSYGLLQDYVNEHMQELVDVVNEYTEFTDNYFNNLDVQEEINNKLDVMAGDGTLSNLLGPIVALTAPSIVTDWLNSHVTPTSPLIDNSLTISGAGADAKVTGDKFTSIETEIPFFANLNGLSSNVVAIPNGTDFNTLTTCGNYKVSTHENMATMLNTPTNVASRMIVLQTTNRDNIYQLIFPNATNNRMFFRFYNGTSWTEWAKIQDYTNYLALSFGDTTIIPNGTDFNTLTVPGNYRVSSGNNMGTMINVPVGVASRLIVSTIHNANAILQVLIPSARNAQIWIRKAYSGAWQPWFNLSETIRAESAVITGANKENYFTDFNNAPINTVYTVASSARLDNSPAGTLVIDRTGEALDNFPVGSLFTFGGATLPSGMSKMQIFMNYHMSTKQAFLNFRTCYSSSSDAEVWTKWEKYSEQMAITATNTAIRAEMVIGGDAPFVDLNDAPVNSIYQLDLDLTDGVMANNPVAGHSGVLITAGFGYNTRHGMVQMCYGLRNGVVLYIRYGYLDGGQQWTPWKKVSAGFAEIPKGPTTDGTYVLKCTTTNGVQSYSWVAQA